MCISVVVRTSTWHAVFWDSIPCSDQACYIMCKNPALDIRDCVSVCLSEETLKAVGPFSLVSMPGEVKDPTQGVNVHPVLVEAGRVILYQGCV